MKRKEIEKWVEALESGEYTQHIGSLRNTDNGSMCCLGVFCKVNNWYKDKTLNVEYNSVRNEGFRPEIVRRIYMRLEKYLDGSGLSSHDLIELNDELKYDFKDIAKAIREKILRDIV